MASLLLEQYSLINIAVRSFVLLILTTGIAFALRRRSAAYLHEGVARRDRQSAPTKHRCRQIDPQLRRQMKLKGRS